MNTPKHIWPSSLSRKLASVDDASEPRYTLTEGEEWDALMRDAREARSFVDAPPAVEVVALRWAVDSLLAYFGETK